MPLGNPLPSPNFLLSVADPLPLAAQLRFTVPTAVPLTTGGTLAAGTYYYTITATNGSGEAIAGPQIAVVTTGATSSVVLTWTQIPGATGYKIYRRTTATGAAVYQTVAAVGTFTDTGAAGTGGTEPAPTWNTVSLINSWDATYNESVSEYDVFGLADPIEVNGRAKGTMSFGGYLADSTDSGQTTITNHEQAKDFIVVRVLWDGTNGFYALARIQTKKAMAKAGASLIEVQYTFVFLPTSIVLVGLGPVL